MSLRSLAWSALRRTLLPNRKDLVGGLILSAISFFAFAPGLIFAIPLVISAVLMVFVLRRLWLVAAALLAARAMKARADKGLKAVKGLLN